MSNRSAGILAYRVVAGEPEVLLVHPGGPFWRNKDAGAWTIPKGEIDAHEDPQAAALREFREELGIALPGRLVPLGQVRQRGGKSVEAFVARADFDAAKVRSNTFELEWPPRSGRMQEFPEVDRAEWFALPAARAKINAAQVALLDRLVDLWSRELI